MQPSLAPASTDPPFLTNVPILRDQPEHLLPPPPPTYQPVTSMMSTETVTSPQDPGHSPTQTAGSDHSDGDNGQSDGRKGYGKRELSTSKRAAQNRAAQRAFRQRKEGYIKKLEEQVRDYQVLSENFKAVQAENYQLRDYIINLQSRLLESQHEVPPPPSNVDGLQPGKPHQHSQTPTLPRIAEMGTASSRITTLPSPSSAVADLGGTTSVQDKRHDQPMSDSTFYEQQAKRLKTDMTPAQAALQGPGVLGQTSPVSR